MAEDREFLIGLGERITTYRRAENLTQMQLAEKLGVTQAVIALYELGQRCIPLPRLIVLAEALNVRFEDILGLDGHSVKRPGPKSKLERQMEELRRLPAPKQKLVSDLIATVLQSNDLAANQ